MFGLESPEQKESEKQSPPQKSPPKTTLKELRTKIDERQKQLNNAEKTLKFTQQKDDLF